MKIGFAGKFRPILDSTYNVSPMFTSHIRDSLERVDTSIYRTSRERRPGGAPTADEDLYVLFDTKELSVVVFSVVLCPLHKIISK